MTPYDKKLLYIDSEPEARLIYGEFFRQRVATVLMAEDGKSGLEKYMFHQPDLVVTDLKLSDTNGIEVIKSIRQADHNVRIIAFSAHADEDFLMDQVRELVDDVIFKPANNDVLDQAVVRLCEDIDLPDRVALMHTEDDSPDDGADERPLHEELTLVGIGASAGGLEALTALVKGLPQRNRSAYLIAQHLSPTHKTMLVDLLSRETPIPVVDAEHGAFIEADTIYITPPNKNIEVSRDNRILLSAPESYSFLPKPSVNQLFISLAANKKDRAIGIILSGTGTDGAQGMRAINAEGGITIVQEPSSAKYDGMPLSSINSCSIDMVLEPGQIGDELVELSNFPRKRVLRKFQIMQPNDDMATIFRLLFKHKKVDFSIYKKATIGRRIERRMVANKVTSLRDYVSILRSDEREVAALFNDMLISVTSFFRDREAFDALSLALTQYLTDHPKQESFRIWIPGSATGEEAYSVLITVLEALAALQHTATVRMFATDIDEEALKVARKGVYSEASITDVDEGVVKRYFDIEEGQFAVKKELREHIVFSYHNLLSDPPFKEVDLVVCRNLLIYLTLDAQKYVMPTFHYALRNNGVLFLGKSENATYYEHFFAPLDKRNKVFKQIPSSKRDFVFFKPKPIELPQAVPIDALAGEGKHTLRELVTEEAGKILLPNVIVTNEQLELLYKKGELDYVKLPDGYVSYNLYKMIDPRLSVDLRALVNAAQKDTSGEPRSTGFIPLPTSVGGVRYVRIYLIPVVEKRQFNYVFYFQEISDSDMPMLRLTESEGNEAGDQLLQLELQRTKEHMQTLVEELETTNEELQSTNEELQSSNEELQSTNEELETSNEELQSTNEELHTAYAELKEIYSANHKSKLENELLNKRYENLLENMSEAVMVTTMDGLILRANRAMKLLTGQDGDKLLAKNWDEFDTQRLRSQHSAELIKHGLSKPYSLVLDTPLAGERTLVVQDYLIKDIDPNGRSHIWTFLRDITESLMATRERDHLNRQNALILSSIGEGIFGVDERGIITFVNPAAAQMVGWSEKELIGQHSHRLLHSNAKLSPHTAENCPFFMSVRDGLAHPNEHDEFSRKDGSTFPVRYVATPKHEDGGVKGAVVAFQDISSQLAREQQLTEAKQAAEEANRAKSAFLSNMSHEIRTPINIVIGQAWLLMDREDLDDSVKRDLQQIKLSGHMLLELVNNILDLSKIEAGELSIERIPVDLDMLLHDLMVLVAPEVEKKQLVFNFAGLPTGVNPQVIGDPVRLRQMLLNLIHNALKFTTQGEVGLSIEAVAAPDGADGSAPVQWLRFQVFDTGVGIAPDAQVRLFNAFQQADASVTRKYGGTGLGLVIVKQLCDAMGGQLSVQSELGKGSCFTILLPLTVNPDPKPAARRDVSQAPKEKLLTGLHIHLVDDLPLNLEVGSRILERQGAQVTVSVNGAEALDWLKSGDRAVDLILMDIQMPVMDGNTAVRAIRQMPHLKHTPVVALTAGAMASERDQALAAGMNDYLTKPIDPDRLLQVILRQLPDKAVAQVPAAFVVTPVADTPDASGAWPQFAGFERAHLSAALNEDLFAFKTWTEKFVTEHADLSKTMHTLYEANRREDIAKLCHGLVSYLGNLGARPLSQAAGALELAIKQGEADLKAPYDAFQAHCQVYFDGAREWLATVS